MKLIKSEGKNNMPQIEFYINDSEREELFEYILANNGEVILGIIYPSEKLELVKTKQDFTGIIALTTTQFFIVSPYFQLFPLVLGQHSSTKPRYSINQRHGGPYITLSFSRGFADNAKLKYKVTELHHYGKYIDPEKRPYEFYATDELKQYYKMLVKFLKGKCKQITVEGKKFWVSKEVLKELNLV